MRWQCRFMLHKWRDCKCVSCGAGRDEGHSWHGCRCASCGKSRDEGHDWALDCTSCRICGTARTGGHSWIGCRCEICGTTRDDQHDWVGRCKCGRCGATRDLFHVWRSAGCTVCGKLLDLATVEKMNDITTLLETAIQSSGEDFRRTVISRLQFLVKKTNNITVLWKVTTQSPDAELCRTAVSSLAERLRQTSVNHLDAAWLAILAFRTLSHTDEREIRFQFEGFPSGVCSAVNLPIALLNLFAVAEASKGCVFSVASQSTSTADGIRVQMSYGGLAIIVILKDHDGQARIREPYRDSAYLTKKGPYSWDNIPPSIAQLRSLFPEPT